MKKLNVTKWLVLIGIILAAVIVIIPQTAVAGSSGGPFPGAGCADASVGDWKYAPPPFIGKIQFCYTEDEILISTIEGAPLEQSSNKVATCILEFRDKDSRLYIDLGDFMDLKSVDLQGLCLPDIVETCGGYTTVEVLSVANMKLVDEDSEFPCFEAKVLIMPLTVK